MRFAGVLMLSVIAACSSMPARDRADVASEDEQTIRAALHEWVAANNRGDVEAARQIWAPDVVGWFPQQTEFTNYEAARIAGVKSAAGRSTYELTIDEVIVSGELAVLRDTWRETLTFGSDAAAARVIRSFEVWKRDPDGRWRIFRWISAPEAWRRVEK